MRSNASVPGASPGAPKVPTSRRTHVTSAGPMGSPVLSASAGWGAICVCCSGQNGSSVGGENGAPARAALVSDEGVQKRRDTVQPAPP